VVSPQAFPGIQTPTKIQLPIPPAPNPAPETLSAKTETWSEVWWQRGLHKFQQGDYDGARQNFAKALQEEPNFVPAHNGLGMVFYIYAEYAAAVAAFQTALSLQSFAYIHCNLGSALYQLGDIVGAIAAYRHACHTNPYQASAYYGLGVALFKLRRYGESITAYEQATQIQPGHADSYGGLGRLLYETGDRPGAIVAYRKAMQLNPSYTKLYLTLQLEAV
jgi:superkiller protein 3